MDCKKNRNRVLRFEALACRFGGTPEENRSFQHHHRFFHHHICRNVRLIQQEDGLELLTLDLKWKRGDTNVGDAAEKLSHYPGGRRRGATDRDSRKAVFTRGLRRQIFTIQDAPVDRAVCM